VSHREKIDRIMAEALLDGLVATEHIDHYNLSLDKPTQRWTATGKLADEEWHTGSNVYAFYAAEQLARAILYRRHAE